MAKDNQRKIRTLIVDDSFFMKKLLRDLLSTDLLIEIVGEAKDGAEAVGEAIRLKPDVITMDYHLPKMNGSQAIKEILENNRVNPPAIIMLSAYAKDGAKETQECLNAGAIDFIAKPSGEVSLDIEKIKDELLSKIHNASRTKITHRFKNLIKSKKPSDQNILANKKIVVIGSSTGGPLLVENIISKLPAKIDYTVVIAQHMPEFFIPLFTKRLSKLCNTQVLEVTNLLEIQAGKIYVLPSNKLCSLNSSSTNKLDAKLYFELSDAKDYVGPRPSINYFINSAAMFYKNNCLAIILTGMGDDGLSGCQEVKKQGGIVVAQDPKTAVVSSMPQEIIKNNLADKVVGPNDIVKTINDLIL